uniref:Spermatosis associated 9 n=1 Tax=Oryctolagus cuniculus TaxID=9986 RepID=G1U5F7_RABIT
MPIKPVGWICGQVLKNFSGRMEGIQKVIMDLADEFKDDFPTILRMSQSNQVPDGDHPSQGFLKNAPLGCQHRGLGRVLLSTDSVVKVLRMRLCGSSRSPAVVLAESGSKSFLSDCARSSSLFEILSFPAKTALTSIMYASYAALIYLAVCVNAVLEKVKTILQEEESFRQNRVQGEHSRKAFSEPILVEPEFPDGGIKARPYRSLPEKPDHISQDPKPPAPKRSNKIQVLHSVFDQSTEMNE